MNSGQEIYIDRFSADMVNINDIAHHLSKIQRYGGAQELTMHYSVAQHSILMAEWCYKFYEDVELVKLALLHDASEAYLGDVNSILKRMLPDYMAIEERVQDVILKKYLGEDYSLEWYSVIHALDKTILVNEAKALFPLHIQKKYIDVKCRGIEGIPVNPYRDPEAVKREFLEWCNKLGIKDNGQSQSK
jgi:hypothetical protein